MKHFTIEFFFPKKRKDRSLVLTDDYKGQNKEFAFLAQKLSLLISS